MKLKNSCIGFTNPCTNLCVPLSVTDEYHLKVLESIDLLQCIAANCQRSLAWVYGET